MMLRTLMTTGLSALLLTSCAGLPAPEDRNIQPLVEAGQSSPILRQARAVADWQLSRMDGFEYVATFRDHTADPTGWIQATFFIGLTALADATGDDRYAQAVISHGQGLGWAYGRRPRHADDDAIGQAWLWASERSPSPAVEAIQAPTRARLDAVLAAPSNVDMAFGDARGEQACQVRWCWSDALFMAPPLWTAMTVATGDERYLDHMNREFRATVDALYDQDAHLFYRDSRFIGRKGAQGAKIFWSRGNGWAYAGLARVLALMPADHPSRSYYVDLYRDMTRAIIAAQAQDGFWPVSLLEPGGPSETSGTGFFVYGLAWGVNAGLVSSSEARPAIDRGWAALSKSVGPDGRLGWVQQVGYAPDHVSADDTQLYGVGAFLLAAAQVSSLKGGLS
jgi:hypothetical protein